MFIKKLSAADVKAIILAGKDANCKKITYNDLVIEYGLLSQPQAAEPYHPIAETQPDDLSTPRSPEELKTEQEEQAREALLNHLMLTDPVAYEAALVGEEWTKAT